jgi:protein SCO1/2
MTSFLRTLCVVLGIALAGTAAYYFVIIRPVSATPPPVMGEVADFSLVDTEGTAFTKSKLDGKVWVADLVFTSCQMTCPMLTKKMANVYRSYKLEEGVRFVSVSVDPDTDTPEVLKKYAAEHQVDSSKWHFLTGDFAEIKNLATKSLKLAAEKDANLHSDRFVLVDADSHVRGYYDPADKQSLSKLFNDLALVLKEKKGI